MASVEKVASVEKALAPSWYASIEHHVAMGLLAIRKSAKGFEQQVAARDHAKSARAPVSIQTLFHSSEFLPWDPVRFAMVRELQDAAGSGGKVYQMWDREKSRYVACKRLPNHCIRNRYSEFARSYPGESECPWTDLGCHKFLTSIGFPYGCTLYGVYRGSDFTDVLTTYATDGDWYTWAADMDVPPGPAREALVRPLAIQLLDGMRKLHDLSIVHRDISMENLLLSRLDGDDGCLQVQIIDFGMASTERYCSNRMTGKTSYRAPELHTCVGLYDGFLADAFSVGVTLYCVLASDYPWLSTEPGQCECFDFVRKYGFRKYARTRKLRCSMKPVAETFSKPVLQLLEGLLALDPAKRLTLGERVWQTEDPTRRSVWDEEWLRQAADGCEYGFAVRQGLPDA